MSPDLGLAQIAARDDEERRLLDALPEKYERMLDLRARLGRGSPTAPDRDRLRALSTDYPGALRELETLPTAELESRLAIARDAKGQPLVPAWLLWTASYHARMRALLRSRRAELASGEDRAPAPRGRLNVLCFEALEARFSVPRTVIWHRLFPVTGAKLRPHRA